MADAKKTTCIVGAPYCTLCNERVYFREEKSIGNNFWHMKCFKCSDCKMFLDRDRALSIEDDLYCNICHRKKQANEGNPPKVQLIIKNEMCYRCNKTVYFAEQIIKLNQKWHKNCFTCQKCNTSIQMGSYCEHDGEVYCKKCYNSDYKPVGYGTTLSSYTNQIKNSEDQTPGETDDNNETKLDTLQDYKIIPDAQDLKNIHTANDSNVNSYLDNIKELNNQKPLTKETIIPNKVAIPNIFQNVSIENCSECNSTVFLAERLAFNDRIFHQSCFRCLKCLKLLNLANAITFEKSKIICRGCHTKQMSPLTYTLKE
ncbi:Cysteine-rich protein 2 [Intoshia linei]|uniref:Cysteine-rich protein 2 n=1 Tax=Intoshia linei TaxID=1819745 RepID=A0A177B5X2_9BILA|nr:Cysteine-rich protein 2 [Intoshia linei]